MQKQRSMSIHYFLWVDLELDICIVRVINHFRKVNGVLVGGFRNIKRMNIYTMKVIVKWPIESSKDKQESSYKGSGVTSSGHWAGLTGEQCPVFGIWIKIMKFIQIIWVSSSKDKHSIVIYACWVTPSSWRLVTCCSDDLGWNLNISRIFQEFFEV